MSKSTGSYPSLIVDTTPAGRVPRRCDAAGRDRQPDRAGPGTIHHATTVCDRQQSTTPARSPLDLAISVAIGGDCLADIAPIRSEPSAPGAYLTQSSI